MNTILRNLAAPYLFLLKQGGFVIALALVLAATVYGYYYHDLGGSFPTLIENFLIHYGSPLSLLFKIADFLLIFLLVFFLFNRTFLKIINNPFFNVLGICALAYYLYITIPVCFYIAASIGLSLLIYKYLIRGGDYAYSMSGTYGDSRWSHYKELMDVGLAEERGFILGRDEKTNKVIGFKGEGHVLTVAKTGAGKGVGVVVPNLLNYGGTVIVIDPKGENFIRTVFARVRMQQKICLIDPFGEVHKQIERQLKRIQQLDEEKKFLGSVGEIRQFYEDLLGKVKVPIQRPFQEQIDPGNDDGAGIYNMGFNPLQILEGLVATENFQEVFDQANVIANMLVLRTPDEKDPHWNDKAKMVIKNTIIFICLHEDFRQDAKTLPFIKEFICKIFEKEENFEGFIEDCHTSEFSEYLDSIAAELSLMASEERLSVLSAVLRHLEFVDSPLVKASLTRSGLDLANVKNVRQSIYLVLPASKLDAYARLMRLWVSSIVNAISITPDPPVDRILMIIDEMAQLGKMEPLLQAVSLLRGYGLNLWMIFQDLSQLKSIYGEHQWKTFSSNARFQQFFGISDQETAEYVSALSGTTTILSTTQTMGSNLDGVKSSDSYSYKAEERKLLYPDQLFRTDLQFLFTDGLFPIKARKVKFYSEGLFQVGTHLPFQLREELKTFF